MQTFLAFPDFHKSAACLDMKRLGKQRVETLQILQTLAHGGSWRNHPAVRMWEDQIPALVEYGVAICEEWLSRGYEDTCLGKILAFNDNRVSPYIGHSHVFPKNGSRLPFQDEIVVNGCIVPQDSFSINVSYPSWLGNEDFHKAHRQILLGKNYKWYSQFGWEETPAVQINGKWPYVWP